MCKCWAGMEIGSINMLVNFSCCNSLFPLLGALYHQLKFQSTFHYKNIAQCFYHKIILIMGNKNKISKCKYVIIFFKHTTIFKVGLCCISILLLWLFALNILYKYCTSLYKTLHFHFGLRCTSLSWTQYSRISSLLCISLMCCTVTVQLGKLFGRKLNISFHDHFSSPFSWQSEIPSWLVLVFEVDLVEKVLQGLSCRIKNC